MVSMVKGGGGVKVLRKIYQELVLIRKELQAIRRGKEFCSAISFDGKNLLEAMRNSHFKV